jgi:hypothetical protein
MVGLAVSLGLAGASFANSYGTASIKYVNPTYGGVAGFKVDYNGDGTYEKVYNNNVYTGAYNFSMNMNSPDTSAYAKTLLTPSFSAYCIDVVSLASSSYLPYTISDLEGAPLTSVGSAMTPLQANALRELFGRFYGSVNNLILDEAFAAATWEIVFEPGATYGTWDLDSGRLVMNGLDSNGYGDAHNIAETWLGTLNGDSTKFDNHVFALTNPGTQDYALARAGFGGDAAIPEPLTASSMVLAMVGLARYVVRRRTR